MALMMSSCTLLLFFFSNRCADVINPTQRLFFFLSVPKPLNPNPVISSPHTRRRPLLLHVPRVCPPPRAPPRRRLVPPPHRSPGLHRRRDHAAASPTASTTVTVTPGNHTVLLAITAAWSTPPQPLPPVTVWQTLSLSLSLSLYKFCFTMFGCLPI
jgi:hypothetical protein